MGNILKKALSLLTGDPDQADLLHIPKNRPLKSLTERDLIRLESEIGSKLFGAVPEGHRREFFNLDERTWIWHEEWINEKRKLQTSTIRYEVHDKGIFKVQEGARYSYLDGDELQHFMLAVKLYYEQVARQIYGFDPDTGAKLV